MNFENNRPIYIQLVDEIKIAIISGNILPGEKLLSVRELAIKYKVNPNTVQKALTLLEDEKLIYTERTNGKYVTTNSKLIDVCKEKYINNIIDNFYQEMDGIGIKKEEALKYLKEGNK